MQVPFFFYLSVANIKILILLGAHFDVDLMHRKAEVKAIITDVINNMTDEDDDGEEDTAEDGEGDGEDDNNA